MRFHDGSPFDADATIWNLDSIFTPLALQFEGSRSGLILGRTTAIASFEKLDGHGIAIITREVDAALSYQSACL